MCNAEIISGVSSHLFSNYWGFLIFRRDCVSLPFNHSLLYLYYQSKMLSFFFPMSYVHLRICYAHLKIRKLYTLQCWICTKIQSLEFLRPGVPWGSALQVSTWESNPIVKIFGLEHYGKFKALPYAKGMKLVEKFKTLNRVFKIQ